MVHPWNKSGGCDPHSWLRWISAHGESTGDHRSYGWFEVAIRAAADTPEILAAMADGASVTMAEDLLPASNLEQYANYVNLLFIDRFQACRLGTDIPDNSTKDSLSKIIPRPVFLVAGTSNQYEREYPTRFADVSDQIELWRIPEAGHGGTWNARPDEYEARMLAFFDEHLLDSVAADPIE